LLTILRKKRRQCFSFPDHNREVVRYKTINIVINHLFRVAEVEHIPIVQIAGVLKNKGSHDHRFDLKPDVLNFES
jgi:hypothetical protein